MKVKDVLTVVAAVPLILKQLAGIQAEVKRVADLLEAGLAHENVYVRDGTAVAGKEVDEEGELYTDEMKDLAREVADLHGSKVEG